jgi:hypothetical protein
LIITAIISAFLLVVSRWFNARMDMVEEERYMQSKWFLKNKFWYSKFNSWNNKNNMESWERHSKGHIPRFVVFFVKRFFNKPPDAISDFWHCQKMWMIFFNCAAPVPVFVLIGYWWLGLIVFAVGGVLGNVIFSKAYK